MWPFSRKSKSEGGIVAEFPDGTGLPLRRVLKNGLSIYRRQFSKTRAVISWQGQGSRLDSYHIEQAEIFEDVISFQNNQLTFESLQQSVSSDLVEAPNYAKVSLDITLLSDEELTEVLERAFVDCLGMRPFEDTGSFAIGVELEPVRGTVNEK